MAALTDIETIKALGQLPWPMFKDAEGDFDLDALLAMLIEPNDAWLRSRLDDSIETSTDAGVKSRLKFGLAYLVLADVVAQLGARKVFGTHEPYVSEDSSSYFDGLASFWRHRGNELLDEYIVTETPGTAFARPYFGISSDVDLTTLESVPLQIEDELDLARGFPVRVVEPVMEGV